MSPERAEHARGAARGRSAVFASLRRRALAPLLRHAASRIAARHPELLERMAPLQGRRIVVEAHGLPDLLAVDFGATGLDVCLIDSAAGESAVARIAGDLPALVDLAEGRADGDALFFQRRISIEGETEAVVLLRNALDGAEIDLVGDAFPPLRPLAEPLRRLAGLGAALAARLVSPPHPPPR